MLTAEWQQQINEAWKQRSNPIEPVRQRKQFLCPQCAKQKYSVKMDYLGNRHVKMLITTYDVSFYRCPRCHYEHKEFMRIEGKGKKGFNLGREYGGE